MDTSSNTSAYAREDTLRKGLALALKLEDEAREAAGELDEERQAELRDLVGDCDVPFGVELAASSILEAMAEIYRGAGGDGDTAKVDATEATTNAFKKLLEEAVAMRRGRLTLVGGV